MILKTNIADLRKKYGKENYIAVSIDVDWASDYCIHKITSFFMENDIPLTVFCTHKSKEIESYVNNPMVELGIHPNFCGNSSQGETVEEIIDFCKNLVPNSRCVRSHRWFSSNDMYDYIVEKGIKFDSNECTMMDMVLPYMHRSGVLRIPTYFEDGGFLWGEGIVDFERQGKEYFDVPGLKVLDLHPIHFAINSPSFEYYRDICNEYSGELYQTISEEMIDEIRFSGKGMEDYIRDLVKYVKNNDVKVVSLGQVYDDLVIYEG